MSGELEAAGAAASAGLAAAAIEGLPAKDHPGGGTCRNCHARLAGPYCRACGQPAHIHNTLLGIIEDGLHSVLHLDGRSLRTLPMLIFRPGTLTARYIHGRRAQYLSPFAVFLFSMFMMFFVLTLTGGPRFVEVSAPVPNGPVVAEVRERVAGEVAERIGRAEAPPEPGDWRAAWRGAIARGEVRLDGVDAKTEAKILDKLNNPDLVLYKLQQTAYKFSFLLLPLCLPFVALVFAFRRGIT